MLDLKEGGIKGGYKLRMCTKQLSAVHYTFDFAPVKQLRDVNASQKQDHGSGVATANTWWVFLEPPSSAGVQVYIERVGSWGFLPPSPPTLSSALQSPIGRVPARPPPARRPARRSLRAAKNSNLGLAPTMPQQENARAAASSCRNFC